MENNKETDVKRKDAKRHIDIYDTTLRDGAQAEGISFSVADKLKISARLDEFGLAFIEGGWPGSNPKDEEFFELAKNHAWMHSALAAFSMTRRAGIKVTEDGNLKKILAAGTPVVTLVGKTSDFHVEQALKIPLEENLAMIEESLAFVKTEGRRPFYDCEHFFDSWAGNRDYARRTLEAAARGGAEVLVLCDTNGGTMPDEVADAVRAVIAEFGLPVGIHTHNDCEMGVANALAAVQAGATQVQGTINGFGERTGNCNLVSVIANLQLKMGYSCVPEDRLQQLTHLSHTISEVANLTPDDRQPFVGRSVFAHKGGMHVDAVQKAGGRAYEHIEPESVGNERRILVSELAGTSNVREVAHGMGLTMEKGSPEAGAVLKEVKRLEAEGWEFEGAEASFNLLVQRVLGHEVHLFDFLGARVTSDLIAGSTEWTTEATLKLRVNGEIRHTVADGDGPVHALDRAFRLALCEAYPAMDGIRLQDFKVRVVNTKEGTAAKVRVLIESGDADTSWSTVGVSTNIIEASWGALTQAIAYGLTKN